MTAGAYNWRSLGNGGVARNDLTGRRSYERELRRIFQCARRILD